MGAGTMSSGGAASGPPYARKRQYAPEEIGWNAHSRGPSPSASSASPWTRRNLSASANCARHVRLTTFERDIMLRIILNACSVLQTFREAVMRSGSLIEREHLLPLHKSVDRVATCLDAFAAVNCRGQLHS